MRRKLRRPHSPTISAIRWIATSCALLIACTFANAQQPSADDVSLVPDNIAPHPPPAQPLPYSHKTHLALGLACQTCHVNPDPGSRMTLPITDTCMSCHDTVAKDKPAIMELQKYAVAGESIPWVPVYAITPGVNWSHRTHLNAGAQCETCHGDLRQVEAVAESKAILSMATCINCHKARDAKIECVACHAWPTDQLLGFQ